MEKISQPYGKVRGARQPNIALSVEMGDSVSEWIDRWNKANAEAIYQAKLKAVYDGKERAREVVHVDTGSLKSSIRVYNEPARKYVALRAGGYVTNPDTGRKVDYAGYHEEYLQRTENQGYIEEGAKKASQMLPTYYKHFIKEEMRE